MKVKIDIVSGFLGSGKTTFIKELINDIYSEKNIVVIENEFGDVGIDGIYLKNSNITVKELTSGCICCSFTGVFKDTIKEIIEIYNPERIIIEPTGVAKLSDVLKALKDPLLANLISINLVIVVVNLLKHNLYLNNFGDFYKDQIKNSSIVILSRNNESSPENTKEVISSIRLINKDATISTYFQKPKENDSLPKGDVLKIKRRANEENYNFSSFSYKTSRYISKDFLINMCNKFEDNKDYGFVLRVKGIIETSKDNWLKFDYVPFEFKVEKVDSDKESKICIIGCDLKKEKLLQLLND